MRKFDFNQLGGMPFYQNQFDFLQEAYREPIKALAALGGSGPYKLFGITESEPGIFTDGAVYFDGEVIPFIGGAEAATIVITTYNTSLLFADGISKQVMQRKEATFGTGDVQFNFSDLQMFHDGFGLTARSGWLVLYDVPGTGRLVYNHNMLTNTVSVRGWIKHNDDLSTDEQIWSTGAYGTLPIGMRPTNVVPSSWGLQFPTYIQKNAGGGWMDVILDTQGEVYTGGISCVDSNGNVLLVCKKLPVESGKPIHIVNIKYEI